MIRKSALLRQGNLIVETPVIKQGEALVFRFSAFAPGAVVNIRAHGNESAAQQPSVNIVADTYGMGRGSLALPTLTPNDYALIASVNGAIQMTAAFTMIAATPTPPAVKPELTVTSLPSGASLYIDDILYGVTPVVAVFDGAGYYKFTLKKTGYKDITTHFSLNDGDVKSWYTTLDVGASDNTGDIMAWLSANGVWVAVVGAALLFLSKGKKK